MDLVISLYWLHMYIKILIYGTTELTESLSFGLVDFYSSVEKSLGKYAAMNVEGFWLFNVFNSNFANNWLNG